jgi:antitoxin HicB
MKFYCKVRKEPAFYVASFPDLPNVQTIGETEEKALINAQDALNGCLASDVARGILPPKPKYVGRETHAVDVQPHILVSIEIRKLRGDKSQSEIAERLGIAYQSYQLLENPVKGNPTVKSLERIANALGKKLRVQFT